MAANTTSRLFARFDSLPLDQWLFSRLICFKAPYFASIKPTISKLQDGYCQTHLVKRRRVTNHIGTVHAIASCNLAELTAGLLMEASIPDGMRWIPKSMSVDYLKKATSNLRAEARLDFTDWQEAENVIVPVAIYDEAGVEVVHADITMWVSPKSPKRSAN